MGFVCWPDDAVERAAPSRVLAKAMREVGKVAVVKIYPAHGTTHAGGHSFTWRGGSVWSRDVFRILGRYCQGTR